jgi:hypothetical protein
MILNSNYHIFEYKTFQESVDPKSEFVVFVEFNKMSKTAFPMLFDAFVYLFEIDENL